MPDSSVSQSDRSVYKQARDLAQSISETLEGILELAGAVPEAVEPVLGQLREAMRIVDEAYERIGYE